MNKSWIISMLCLSLAAGMMAWGFRNPTEQIAGGARYCALMTEDLGTDVMQFKQGAQAAAKELGASVEFLTCAQDRPVTEELASFLQSLKAIAPDGVILPPPGEGVLPRALSLGEALGIPVVCLFEARSEGAVSVETDFEDLGRQLGESALRQGGASGYTVFNGASRAEARALRGLEAVLGPPAQVYACETSEDARLHALSLPAGTTAFALNAELTLELAEHAGRGVRLWGVDPGKRRAELLESGAVWGLAMRMPYAQGYQAVMAAADGVTGEGASVRTPARVVTRDTMYLSENVKLMFPLLQ